MVRTIPCLWQQAHLGFLVVGLNSSNRLLLHNPAKGIHIVHFCYIQVDWKEIRIYQINFFPWPKPFFVSQKSMPDISKAGYIEMLVISQQFFTPNWEFTPDISKYRLWLAEWAFTRLCSHPLQIVTALHPTLLPQVTKSHLVDRVGDIGTWNWNSFNVSVENDFTAAYHVWKCER